MARERIKLEPAWLLSQRPYRETSALLELLTATHGRVGLVARGVRGTRSRLRGVLQLFQPLLVSWTLASDLGTLTGAESAGRSVELNGEQVFYGWYVNELLLRLLLRHEPQPEIHAVYGRILPGLCGESPSAVLRQFEADLLDNLGYGLPLEGNFDADRYYEWNPEQGARPAAHGQGVRGAALIALRERDFGNPATRREVRLLLRTAIDCRLDGRELKTRKMLYLMRGRMGK